MAPVLGENPTGEIYQPEHFCQGEIRAKSGKKNRTHDRYGTCDFWKAELRMNDTEKRSRSQIAVQGIAMTTTQHSVFNRDSSSDVGSADTLARTQLPLKNLTERLRFCPPLFITRTLQGRHSQLRLIQV